MPGFIERHPLFFASAFVLSGAIVLVGVCMYVHIQDLRDERKKQRRALSNPLQYIPEDRVRFPRGPKAAASDRGDLLITQAVGSITDIFAGEPPKMPKFAAWGSQESTSASGDLTPRSNAPSLGSSSDTMRQPPISIIRSGTVLMVRIPEVVFASPTSWREIGELSAGQEVVAAGAPEMVDDYTMVPIRPRGAVDLKVLEVVRDRREE
jgi:hypothetical protein